jgi:hypothetical protein
VDENKIDQLVKMELQESYVVHGGFNSKHEGYAVLKEEIEEAEHEFRKVKAVLNNMWNSIKANERQIVRYIAERALETAKKGIAEMIQVAAMCEKMVMFIEGEEPRK